MQYELYSSQFAWRIYDIPGLAEQRFKLNKKPEGGTCIAQLAWLSFEDISQGLRSGNMDNEILPDVKSLVDFVRIQCYNWTDPEELGVLKYTFYGMLCLSNIHSIVMTI